MHKRIVITGASGMLGSHLIELALSKDDDVKAVVRKNSPKIGNIPVHENVSVIECDNDDIGMLAKLIKKPCDVFFHFAWEGVAPVRGGGRSNAVLQAKNITNTLAAIETAKSLGCAKFVLAGSQAEYGLKRESLKCDTETKPFTAYGIAKNTAFNLGKVLAEQLGIEICNGRVLSAYGPKDNSYTMISSMLSKMISGETCDLSPCTQIWDFIFAEDAARAFYLIGEKGVDGKAYPIGSGVGKPLKEYVETMYALAGNPDAKLNYGAVALKEDAVSYLKADISELTKDTGFVPKYSFEDGIVKTIEWQKANLIGG